MYTLSQFSGVSTLNILLCTTSF